MGSVASQETLEKTSPQSSSKDFPIWDEECERWIEKRWKQNPEELQLYTELYRAQMNNQMNNHVNDPETSFQHMATLRGLMVQGEDETYKGEQELEQ
jgi:hypothetical protein